MSTYDHKAIRLHVGHGRNDILGDAGSSRLIHRVTRRTA